MVGADLVSARNFKGWIHPPPVSYGLDELNPYSGMR